jgi:hypothetical protein
VVLITEMLEICIQASYDQNVQLILKSYLPVVYDTPFRREIKKIPPERNEVCRVLKFVGPIGPRRLKIMRSANIVGNAGHHVRQTFLNDVFTFLSRKRRLYYKYRNKFGQLGICNRIENVIFYLFLVNIIGNCHENKYV